MKKNIAIINSVYKTGSTGRICFEMASFLSSKNNIVKVFYGRGKKINDGIGCKFSLPFNFLIHAILARLFDGDSRYSFFSTMRLIKKLRKFNPNVIILNNLHGYYINFKKLIKYISENKIKVIYVFHDCWPMTGHCAHFDFVQCKKYKTVCNNCYYKKAYPKSILFSASTRNFLLKKKLLLSLDNLTIVCPSKWMKSKVKSSFLKKINIVVINNGIDTLVFSKRKYDFFDANLTNSFKLILCVANIWDNRKGINDVIKMSRLLKENEKIILVGKLASKVMLNNKIIYIEHTNSIYELSKIYNSCDIFFNPTYEDTFSNVNMEAISCGLPVVCYRTGGAFEMVDENFVVNQGDILAARKLFDSYFNDLIKFDFSNITSFDKHIMYLKYIELIEKM